MEGEEEVEVGLGSVLVSRATVAAVRGGLVSRAEEGEVGRETKLGCTWFSEVAGVLVGASEAAASRRARNSARRAALRRRSHGGRRRAGRAGSPPPGTPGGWRGCWWG